MGWQVRLVSDLTKVYPDATPTDEVSGLVGHIGRRACFQVALLPPATRTQVPTSTPQVLVSCPDAVVSYFQVRLVPVDLPCFAEHDEGYERTTPGLFPDVLEPSDGQVQFTHLGWHALWVDLILGEGSNEVAIKVREGTETTFERRLGVEALACPPAPPVTFLQWLHTDCLADYYGFDVWSDEHWESIVSFLRAAAEMGVTGVLAPLWTPPLDTAPDHYRTTTQLIGITDGKLGLGFDTGRLDRWLTESAAAGLRDIECPHLFTQWGAQATPAIVIDEVRQFGWDVPATDPRYRRLMGELIPFLRRRLERAVGAEHVWWHISDEPTTDSVDSYTSARDVVADLLNGAQVIDAVSEPEFAFLVDIPVVATSEVRAFRSAGLDPSWAYHCMAQTLEVSNRFIAQSALRHRVIAEHLYLGQARGFLHWGFNFYSTALSRARVDPFRDTCAGGRFPGGDPFIVYPGPQGQAWPSLRHRVLGAAWDDLAQLYYAERLVGRDTVVAMLGATRDYATDSGTISDYRRRQQAVRRLISTASSAI